MMNCIQLILLTIFLHIVPTLELASVSASTHCLDSFALLCIITLKSISSSITFYTRKRQTQRANKGSNQRRRPRGDCPPQNLRWGDGPCIGPPQYFEK